jgi:hypothetical protein
VFSAHTPILEVIKRHPKEIVLSAFARMAEQAPFYIFTAFIFSYGIGTLHVSRDFLLTAVLVASVLSFFSIPFFGHLSDRIGRKNMYMIGAVVTGVFGFVYFGMLNTGVCDRPLYRGVRGAELNRNRADDRLQREITWRRNISSDSEKCDIAKMSASDSALA